MLTDILYLDSNNKERERKNLMKGFRARTIIRQVFKVSLKDLKKHVYKHPAHNADPESADFDVSLTLI